MVWVTLVMQSTMLSVPVNVTSPVAELRARVAAATSLWPADIALFYGSRRLADEETFATLGLTHQDQSHRVHVAHRWLHSSVDAFTAVLGTVHVLMHAAKEQFGFTGMVRISTADDGTGCITVIDPTCSPLVMHPAMRVASPTGFMFSMFQFTGQDLAGAPTSSVIGSVSDLISTMFRQAGTFTSGPMSTHVGLAFMSSPPDAAADMRMAEWVAQQLSYIRFPVWVAVNAAMLDPRAGFRPV